jgi:nucleoside-diphosphate-sugar epimerase
MILVSGATGFIGQRLIDALCKEGVECRCMVRRSMSDSRCVVADLADKDALDAACAGVESVFHCAGYSHAYSSLSGDDAARHWRVNFEGTRNFVEAAGQTGVRRFVFLSSVKAMAGPAANCADEDSPGRPETAYGQAKRAAEEAVLEAGKRYGMHVVNLRLAMVYGKGGRGNLERMGRLVGRGFFPPLPENGNHRSLVHVDDVVDAIRLVATDLRAGGRTFIIANRDAPSGRELFDMLRLVAGLPRCKWAVPETALRMAARLGDALEMFLRRRIPLDSETLERLLGSAWYSPARIERELGWRAKVPLADGLSEMLEK